MREDAYAAALGGLTGATARRLQDLLEQRSASEAFELIKSGSRGVDTVPNEVLAEWQQELVDVDLFALSEQLDGADAYVSVLGETGFPAQLSNDIDPAPLLFCRGTLPDPALAHVAVIGTRRASSIGREVARELGMGLAEAGVVVVSGLALGIDGEAHRGALLVDGASPLAVVGSGVDVVYPKRHGDLWHQVASAGALVSEAPLGARPEPWRFPARNRLIAAFADLVVVVESRHAGGSLLTVEEALRRDVEVMAVPGSVRNKAADGTNQLLVDGASPARDVKDVLVALGLSALAVADRRSGSSTASSVVNGGGFADTASAPVGQSALVLDAIDDGPTSLDEIVGRSGIGVVDVCARVEELVANGLVMHDGSRIRKCYR